MWRSEFVMARMLATNGPQDFGAFLNGSTHRVYTFVHALWQPDHGTQGRNKPSRACDSLRTLRASASSLERDVPKDGIIWRSFACHAGVAI
jgi:hypothetical protein